MSILCTQSNFLEVHIFKGVLCHRFSWAFVLCGHMWMDYMSALTLSLDISPFCSQVKYFSMVRISFAWELHFCNRMLMHMDFMLASAPLCIFLFIHRVLHTNELGMALLVEIPLVVSRCQTPYIKPWFENVSSLTKNNMKPHSRFSLMFLHK